MSRYKSNEDYYKQMFKAYSEAVAEFNVLHPELAYELQGIVLKHTGISEPKNKDKENN